MDIGPSFFLYTTVIQMVFNSIMNSAEFEVCIIGSGFAGLCMAIHLRRRGISFVVLEQGSDIGGVWRDNIYPGCACDVPSHLYSFSFAAKTNWSRTYASQSEIWDYLKGLTDQYRLRPAIRFNSKVSEAVFDETNQLWDVRMQTGETLTAHVLISGIGLLSRPAYPKLPGLERFQGHTFHSARWDHGFELQGKRVAVIGTGASAIQFVPQIAPQVAQLHLFQRTPPWIVSRNDHPIGVWKQALFRWVPGYRRIIRYVIYWGLELRAFGFTRKPHLLKHAQKWARQHLEASVADPTLRAQLTPNYLLGCKRVLVSDDYYPAVTRSNVELITNGIAEVREHSIVGLDGKERPVDAIIYGTGFRDPSLLTPLRIIGRNGIDLNSAWRNGAEAYLGITVSGYPNFFMVVGPNTGVGHTSMVFMMEAQVHYVMKCLTLLRERATGVMELQSDAQARFNRKLQKQMERTVWKSGCRSWYLDENGKNVTLWPGFSCDFWIKTRRVETRDYIFTKI